MYQCKKCGWEGKESELEYDSVDTCFGEDKVEMCPICGDMEVTLKRKEV